MCTGPRRRTESNPADVLRGQSPVVFCILFFAISLGMAYNASKGSLEAAAPAASDLGVMGGQPAPAAGAQVPHRMPCPSRTALLNW